MDKKCEYCGGKANFVLKNGKLCCNKSVNSCPVKKAKATSRKGINLGKLNGKWGGDKISYTALHTWIRNRLEKPLICFLCKKKRKLQLSCKKHEYSRDLSVWIYLCQSCHFKKDNKKKKRIYYCKNCNKIISRTSGKYGKGRCNTCANSTN